VKLPLFSWKSLSWRGPSGCSEYRLGAGEGSGHALALVLCRAYAVRLMLNARTVPFVIGLLPASLRIAMPSYVSVLLCLPMCRSFFRTGAAALRSGGGCRRVCSGVILLDQTAPPSGIRWDSKTTSW